MISPVLTQAAKQNLSALRSVSEGVGRCLALLAMAASQGAFLDEFAKERKEVSYPIRRRVRSRRSLGLELDNRGLKMPDAFPPSGKEERC